MTKAAQSALLRSKSPRAVQCRHRRQMHRHAVTDVDAVAPVVRLGADRRIMGLHDRVLPERRDDAWLVHGVEARQRRDVEMVVMAVADEYEVDLRQRLEGDAGAVDPLRAGEGDGRDPGPTRRDRAGCSVRASATARWHGRHRRRAVRRRRPAPAACRCAPAATRRASGHARRHRTASAAARRRASAARRGDRRSACRRNDR